MRLLLFLERRATEPPEDSGGGAETRTVGSDGKTEMTFRQTGFRSVESRDSHRDGWNECFDKLPGFLAQA